MLSAIDALRSPAYQERLQKCVHCGLCLSACPTYAILGTEADSPRGRIALMRAAAAGQLDAAQLAGSFATHLSLCLECRGCESACPSGVAYGSLVEPARRLAEERRRIGLAERLLRWAGLRQLMPHRNRLRALRGALGLYQRSGLPRLVRRMRFLPAPLRAMERLLPPISTRPVAQPLPAAPLSEPRGRVAMFLGCVQDAFLGQVNDATRRVLQYNGYEVIAPPLQRCCGAAQAHVGDQQAARALARQNIAAFEALQIDALIVNAGGCGLTLKEYGHLLADDPQYAARAQAFAAQVQDISQFLASHLHVPPRSRIPVRAVYVDSCHLRHGQKVFKQPRELLRQIAGLELIELQHADRCCGSAGVYNIAHPELADQILAEKIADIRNSAAELVVVSNTGCHLQLLAGVREAGLPIQVRHIVEVLDQAYGGTA